MQNGPIGIFDSGVGGTSIWKEIKNLLPNENTLYLADSKNAPYGEKSSEEILELCVKNTELLLSKGSKIIVVACNTATTNAINYLRHNYQIPFVGIEPAIKPAALRSKTKIIGVLATKGTLSSSLFNSTSEMHASGIKIIEQEGAGLVPLIEQGKVQSAETRELLEEFLNPMLAEGIDYLVLGCTHYPYLVPVLREILSENVTILDSGEAVARQTRVVLEKFGLNSSSSLEIKHQFYSNADVDILKAFLNDTAESVQTNFLDF